MDIIKQVYTVFDNFQDEKCDASTSPNWRPDWEDEVEGELELIRQNSPIPLPEDYCEIFRAFGGGAIEDKRENYAIPEMSFWIWEDMEDFDATVEFFEGCPDALPIGDDIGDMVYLLMDGEAGHGIYMAEKSLTWDADYRHKIADSFTELFTSEEIRRRFRNIYRFGSDEGGDGR